MLPKFIPLIRDFRRLFFYPKKEWQVVWGSTFQNRSIRAANYSQGQMESYILSQQRSSWPFRITFLINLKLQRAILCSHAYPALFKWPFSSPSSFCFVSWLVPGDLPSPTIRHCAYQLKWEAWGGGGRFSTQQFIQAWGAHHCFWFLELGGILVKGFETSPWIIAVFCFVLFLIINQTKFQ